MANLRVALEAVYYKGVTCRACNKPEYENYPNVGPRTHYKDCPIPELETAAAALLVGEEPPADPFRAALEHIALSDDECQCEHDTENCCALVNGVDFCARCAAAALAASPRVGAPSDMHVCGDSETCHRCGVGAEPSPEKGH